MSNLDSIVALNVFGRDIDLQEALRTLKVRDTLVEAFKPVIDDAIISRAVEEMGITIDDDVLQTMADTVRTGLGLQKAEDTHAWLEENGLTVEQFEARLRNDYATDLVKQKLAEGQIDTYFAEHRAEFDMAVLSHVVVEDEGMAQELLSQIQDEDADLGELAGRHSVDEATKGEKGSLGLVQRDELSPSIQKAVFNGAVGDVVGPLKTDQGYHVIRIDELNLGELDDEAREGITERIYEEWLDEQYVAAKADLKLLEVV